MKRNRLRKSAKKAVLTATMALVAAGVLRAGVHSDVVTASKWTQPAGPSYVGFLAHPAPTYTGMVTAVAGDVITIDGTLTAGALNSVLIDGSRDTAQYVIKLRHDRTGDGPQNQGDWFKIVSNTATTVTVDPNAVIATASSIAVGDYVQIEKLPTLNQAYGTGAAGLFDQDSDFDDTTPDGDTLYVLSGGGFGENLIYHDGSLTAAGWWDTSSGLFIGDGSTYTFTPDQTLAYVNGAGAAYDVTLAGSIQCFGLSHFILTGLNGVVTGFAAPPTLDTAGLYLAPAPGQTFNNDAGSFDDTISDAVYTLSGLSFDKNLIYHDGSAVALGWWDTSGGTQEGALQLEPAKGLFVKNTGAPYVWRQPKP